MTPFSKNGHSHVIQWLFISPPTPPEATGRELPAWVPGEQPPTVAS